jgi:hypothetical protein
LPKQSSLPDIKVAGLAEIPSMTEVNSFWHGGELSNLEKFCISSFLRNGVKYSLYAYEAPANLPPGAILKDANEFVPRSQLFTYKAGTFNRGSVAGFSNLFRYTLIHQCGGWWTDTDVCYINGVIEDTDERFFEEATQDGSFRVATALFKCSPGSPVLRYCLDRFAEKDVTRIVHGETGPSLFTAAVVACQKQHVVSKGNQAFPVPWWEYERAFFDPDLSIDNCAAVHFWNAMLSAGNIDKNAQYPPESAFERLKRKYL